MKRTGPTKCEAYSAALKIYLRLACDHPSVTEYEIDLATVQNNIGVLLGDTQRPDEALKAYNAALEIRERLIRANPALASLQSDLARTHNGIGVLQSSTGPLLTQ